MKPTFALFLVLIATLCFSLCYPTNVYARESFIEGACSAEAQTQLQNNVNQILQQPIINTDNVVVDANTAINDITKIARNGKYSDCNQAKELQNILDKNPQPSTALPALKSYYTTIQNNR